MPPRQRQSSAAVLGGRGQGAQGPRHTQTRAHGRPMLLLRDVKHRPSRRARQLVSPLARSRPRTLRCFFTVT
eukprot:scaffold78499_cov54-Phaeocystis_antarctica.AAC.1